MKINYFFVFMFLAQVLWADAAANILLLESIKKKIDDPSAFLDGEKNLVFLGNTSPENANIIFLPEIHDDPHSLLMQVLLLAREKQRGSKFIVLDESLASFKQSSWELFSQKSLEILAANQTRKQKLAYSPRGFELNMKNIADEIKNSAGQLIYVPDLKVWSFEQFEPKSTPFYGWDSPEGGTLLQRNKQMVKSLSQALENNQRIFVMLGARHVPELEYLSSKFLLCKSSRLDNKEDYFSALNKKYGDAPELSHGIGSSLPVYNFLSQQKYAVIFDKNLYPQLYKVINGYAKAKRNNECVNAF